jgi:hypothetical protein
MWVIQGLGQPGGPLLYLRSFTSTKALQWTVNPKDASRFPTKAEAEKLFSLEGMAMVRAVEQE